MWAALESPWAEVRWVAAGRGQGAAGLGLEWSHRANVTGWQGRVGVPAAGQRRSGCSCRARLGQGSTSALATLSTRCPFDSHADARKLTRLEVSVRVFGISIVFKGMRAGVWGRVLVLK